jgi:hypothetical protein
MDHSSWPYRHPSWSRSPSSPFQRTTEDGTPPAPQVPRITCREETSSPRAPAAASTLDSVGTPAADRPRARSRHARHSDQSVGHSASRRLDCLGMAVARAWHGMRIRPGRSADQRSLTDVRAGGGQRPHRACQRQRRAVVAREDPHADPPPTQPQIQCLHSRQHLRRHRARTHARTPPGSVNALPVGHQPQRFRAIFMWHSR